MFYHFQHFNFIIYTINSKKLIISFKSRNSLQRIIYIKCPLRNKITMKKNIYYSNWFILAESFAIAAAQAETEGDENMWGICVE